MHHPRMAIGKRQDMLPKRILCALNMDRELFANDPVNWQSCVSF